MGNPAGRNLLLMSFNAEPLVLGKATQRHPKSRVEVRVETAPTGYDVSLTGRGLVHDVDPVLASLESHYGPFRVRRKNNAKGILEAERLIRTEELPKAPIIPILVELLRYVKGPVLRFEAGIGTIAGEILGHIEPEWLVAHLEGLVQSKNANFEISVQPMSNWIPRLVSQRSRTST